MFDEKIAKLFFGDQIIPARVRADRVTRNGRDGDHVVDSTDTRISDIVNDISCDQASEMSGDIERIMFVLFLDGVILIDVDFRGEFIE